MVAVITMITMITLRDVPWLLALGLSLVADAGLVLVLGLRRCLARSRSRASLRVDRAFIVNVRRVFSTHDGGRYDAGFDRYPAAVVGVGAVPNIVADHPVVVADEVHGVIGVAYDPDASVDRDQGRRPGEHNRGCRFGVPASLTMHDAARAQSRRPQSKYQGADEAS